MSICCSLIFWMSQSRSSPLNVARVLRMRVQLRRQFDVRSLAVHDAEHGHQRRLDQLVIDRAHAISLILRPAFCAYVAHALGPSATWSAAGTPRLVLDVALAAVGVAHHRPVQLALDVIRILCKERCGHGNSDQPITGIEYRAAAHAGRGAQVEPLHRAVLNANRPAMSWSGGVGGQHEPLVPLNRSGDETAHLHEAHVERIALRAHGRAYGKLLAANWNGPHLLKLLCAQER
jgi:hypothetical protein